ncbi:MAG: hypothetical protein ACRDKV_03280, partial [Solirubrobacterales bacterium]
LAGSLDRSVDVAATLELRGYGLPQGARTIAGRRSRYDRRFWIAALALAGGAVAARLAGGGGFDAYPRVEIASDGLTWAVAAATLLAGLVPIRRRPFSRAGFATAEAARA